MKRNKIVWLLIIVLLLMSISFETRAESESDVILTKARATAYCLPGTTASGQEVRKGICASSNPEYFGKTLIMYQRLPDGTIGELIGIYEVLDTGCKNHVVDVWCPDLNECQEFMNRVYEDGCQGKVYIQIIESEGKNERTRNNDEIEREPIVGTAG